MKQYAALDDTVYFWFAANDTKGSGGDGASPAADVRLAGAAADAAPVYGPTPVLLSHANYPAGAYEIAIAATEGNGFGANNTYAVFCTLAIDAQNPTGFVGSFDLKAVKATLDGEKVAITDAAETQMVDAVCDEPLTGATHNVPTSLGKRIRQIAAYAILSGTAQAGTATTITIAATTDVGDGIINRNLIVIVSGTGAGQTRTIADYNNTTKVCVINREWRIDPDDTSEYQILADDTPLVVDHGIARGGTATTITLREYASSEDDNIYECNIIGIIGGKGRGQARLVGSYDCTSKIVTICGKDWKVIPDTTSVYVMIPYGTTCTSCVDDYALGQIADAVSDAEVGPGALSCTWTQKDADENPMDNVQIWITTDEAGVNVIAGTLLTNAQGKATFMLDAGTYYVWREKAGKNFTNPQIWSVS